MALTKHEREQFLAEPRIAALSVSAGPDRGPLNVPIWYQYAPGGQPWVLTQVAIYLAPEHWLSADLGSL